MKIVLDNFKQNTAVFMRACGYALDKQGEQEQSFVRRIAGADYPRFHAYVSRQGDNLLVNLHIDQKKPSYAGSAAHSGEYEGELVGRETERIKSYSRSLS